MDKHRLSIEITGDFDRSQLLDALHQAIPDIVAYIEANAGTPEDDLDDIEQSACVGPVEEN